MNVVTRNRGALSHRLGGGMTRRDTLRGLGGVTAAIALAAGFRPGVAAQDATPAVPELLAAWTSAWMDPAQVAMLYAAAAVLEDVAAGVDYTGPDAIAAHIADIRAGFPDVVVTVASGFVMGDRAAAEYDFIGTYRGQLPGLPEGAGQSVAIRGAALFELADGRIVREAHYYDAYAFLIQLGILTAPGAAATPAP